MKTEVQLATRFLIKLVQCHSTDIVLQPLHESQLANFKDALEKLLTTRYYDHWYPEVPSKGSAFRCIRNNVKMDPILEQAGIDVGIEPTQLRKMLPAQLTMWIDPNEVSYRIGENGSICILYEPGDGRSFEEALAHLTDHFTRSTAEPPVSSLAADIQPNNQSDAEGIPIILNGSDCYHINSLMVPPSLYCPPLFMQTAFSFPRIVTTIRYEECFKTFFTTEEYFY